MEQNGIVLIAFDLDGTLTQHKSPLEAQNRAVLDALSRRYRLVMVGAGAAVRIFHQMGEYPIDIIGNYGLQWGRYCRQTRQMVIVRDLRLPCDRQEMQKRVERLRKLLGCTAFAGEMVEYHDSGCVTIPLLGTAAGLEAKLRFDPDRRLRRQMYPAVAEAFPEYSVFVGGSSSFDLAPRPYDKYYALDEYCRQLGLSHAQAAYVGDDYGPGGNDESVWRSDFSFFPVEDYRRLPQALRTLLEE